MTDAVIRCGGKQYRVQEGSVLDVATIDATPGSSIELRDVLFLSSDGRVTLGEPNVANAVVVAEVVEHGKGPKVINFKFKAKTRYRRKRGHRQAFTRLAVREIRSGDAPSAPSRRQAKAAAEPDEKPAEATLAEEKPARPARRTRRAPSSEPEASVEPSTTAGDEAAPEVTETTQAERPARRATRKAEEDGS